MVKALTGRRTEAALTAALKDDHAERNRKAWNLPRATAKAGSQRPQRDGLDWEAFRDLYYPNTRRHDFAAIVAYGDYKRRPNAGAAVPGSGGETRSPDAPSLAEWESEGGTT